MARAKNVGQGWHGQSIRHSNARLKGKAGGTYAQAKIARVMTEYKKGLLYTPTGKKVKNKKQAVAIALSEAGLTRKKTGKGYLYTLKKYGDSTTPQGSSEEPYIFTSNPTAIKQKSRLKQFAEKAGQFIKKEEKAVVSLAKEKISEIGYNNYIKSELEKGNLYVKDGKPYNKDGTPATILAQNQKTINKILNKWEAQGNKPKETLLQKAKEEAVILAQKAKLEAKKALEEIKNARSRQVDKIANELESIESVDEDTRLRLATMDVKQLTAEELKQLAIVEGESFFGGNKYENELKRRINEEARIETDLTIERAKAKEESRQRLIKPKEDNSESLTNFLFGDL